MTQDQSFERFKILVAAYGSARNRWPEESRALYDRFADTPDAQLLLASAQQLDQFLAGWNPPSREHEVSSRILAALPAQQASKPAPRHSSWSLPAAIMMLFALLGFGHGYFAMDFSDQGEAPSAFGMVEEE